MLYFYIYVYPLLYERIESIRLKALYKAMLSNFR